MRNTRVGHDLPVTTIFKSDIDHRKAGSEALRSASTTPGRAIFTRGKLDHPTAWLSRARLPSSGS
ncbi:hypothetical protein CBOM_07536 [Ceraceosorus bombacis]|uniref:Uncharacterized protein n=1 Tax=Ceraceosorus bombacis TaxID=401625 RepID=A0A0P1BEH8_9BASI|nr:hypothetical protein CBOM_07536 [Ceraceosorus bombacis]